MPRNRYSDALAIQSGACNPHGIVRTLLAHLDEMRVAGADHPTIFDDPALRLIVHQLAFLFHVGEIDNTADVYGKLTDECQRKAEYLETALRG